MFFFKVVILLAACLPWSYCKLDQYCSLCQDHTMCKYSGLGEACVGGGGSGVSEDDKKEILDVHNWARRIVASGHEERGLDGSQPKAANLRKLVWDNELSKVAQRWADQCTFQHDVCRNDPRWRVGQNIFWKWKFPDHQVNWTESILAWYNEVAKHNPRDVQSFSFNPETGHYTQMLWHDTYAVGCGRRDYGDNKLYVCNYGPTGNWIGEPLYAVGEPCSQCPQGTVCEDSLCALPVDELQPGNPVTTGGLFANIVEEGYNDERLKSSKQKQPKPPKEKTKEGGSVMGRTKSGKDENKNKESGNQDDDKDVFIDEETRKEIDRIHAEIEKLLKSFIKKFRTVKKDGKI